MDKQLIAKLEQELADAEREHTRAHEAVVEAKRARRMAGRKVNDLRTFLKMATRE